MNNKAKEAVLILIISLGIFWCFKPKEKDAANTKNGVSKKLVKPKESELDLSNPVVEDAYNCLCIYINAYNDGVTQKELDELNKEISKHFDMQVVKINESMYSVEDMKGKEILTSKV